MGFTEPEHYIDIEGVQYRLRYRFADWARAERIEGEGFRSGYGIPMKSQSLMLPILLLVGLNHCMPGLNLDKAMGLVNYDNEEALNEACVRAVYDYEPQAKKKVQAEMEAAQSEGRAIPGHLLYLGALIQLISSTGPGLSPSDADSADTPSTTSPQDNLMPSQANGTRTLNSRTSGTRGKRG